MAEIDIGGKQLGNEEEVPEQLKLFGEYEEQLKLFRTQFENVKKEADEMRSRVGGDLEEAVRKLTGAVEEFSKTMGKVVDILGDFGKKAEEGLEKAKKKVDDLKIEMRKFGEEIKGVFTGAEAELRKVHPLLGRAYEVTSVWLSQLKHGGILALVFGAIVLSSFVRESEEAFGRAMYAMSTTVSGLSREVLDRIRMMGRGMYEMFVNTAREWKISMEEIGRSYGKLFAVFGEGLTGMEKRTLDWLYGFSFATGQTVDDVIRKMDDLTMKIYGYVERTASGIKGQIVSVEKVLEVLRGTAVSVGRSFNEWYQIFMGLTGQMKWFTTTTENIIINAVKMSDVFMKFRQVFTGGGEEVLELYRGIISFENRLISQPGLLMWMMGRTGPFVSGADFVRQYIDVLRTIVGGDEGRVGLGPGQLFLRWMTRIAEPAGGLETSAGLAQAFWIAMQQMGLTGKEALNMYKLMEVVASDIQNLRKSLDPSVWQKVMEVVMKSRDVKELETVLKEAGVKNAEKLAKDIVTDIRELGKGLKESVTPPLEALRVRMETLIKSLMMLIADIAKTIIGILVTITSALLALIPGTPITMEEVGEIAKIGVSKPFENFLKDVGNVAKDLAGLGEDFVSILTGFDLFKKLGEAFTRAMEEETKKQVEVPMTKEGKVRVEDVMRAYGYLPSKAEEEREKRITKDLTEMFFRQIGTPLTSGNRVIMEFVIDGRFKNSRTDRD